VDDVQRETFVRERPVFVSLIDHRTFQPVDSCYEAEVVALVAGEMLKRRLDYPTDSVLWRKELAIRETLAQLAQAGSVGEQMQAPAWWPRMDSTFQEEDQSH
jgi:hypothetical protein